MKAAASPSPALEVEGLSKAYGGTQALDQVSLKVQRGQIHGLVGRNGSGKSTFIKVLSGYVGPDQGGMIRVYGEELTFPVHPSKTRALGLAFVQQDLALAIGLTVRDNIRVGRYDGASLGRIGRGRERERIQEALAAVGLRVSPEAKVSTLSPVERTLLAVARALSGARSRTSPTLLVLDEPTSQLPSTEIERLFDALRNLVSVGNSVILVTHRIEEAFAITDSVAVLRDGRLIVSDRTENFSPDQIVELMLGEPLHDFYPDSTSTPGEKHVEIESVRGTGWGPVNFSLRRGEIVGVTGLPGMGHENLPLAFFGGDESASGSVSVNEIHRDLSSARPRDMMDIGIGYLPADRIRESGVGTFTVRENVTLPVIGRYMRGLRLSRKAETSEVRMLLDLFRVQPPDPEHKLGQLSGGNQQKALLAKWFQLPPTFFVVHEPTQGIDVSAKAEVFRELIGLAQQGNSVLFVSVEHKDLANICHRVLVMRYGQIVDEIVGERLTETSIAESALNVSVRK